MNLDIVLEPLPATSGRMFTPATAVRVYESSLPGLVAIKTTGDVHGPARGMRLTREQVLELRDALSAYLSRTEPALDCHASPLDQKDRP